MVKNPFLDFDFYTFENQAGSFSSLVVRLRTMTLEKFSKHGFSFFHHIRTFSFES